MLDDYRMNECKNICHYYSPKKVPFNLVETIINKYFISNFFPHQSTWDCVKSFNPSFSNKIPLHYHYIHSSISLPPFPLFKVPPKSIAASLPKSLPFYPFIVWMEDIRCPIAAQFAFMSLAQIHAQFAVLSGDPPLPKIVVGRFRLAVAGWIIIKLFDDSRESWKEGNGQKRKSVSRNWGGGKGVKGGLSYTPPPHISQLLPENAKMALTKMENNFAIRQNIFVTFLTIYSIHLELKICWSSDYIVN